MSSPTPVQTPLSLSGVLEALDQRPTRRVEADSLTLDQRPSAGKKKHERR